MWKAFLPWNLEEVMKSESRDREFRDPRFAELDRLIAAEDQRRARTNTTSATVPRSNLVRKHRSPALPRDYRQDITRMASAHRKKYRLLFMADPKLKDSRNLRGAVSQTRPAGTSQFLR